MERVGAGRVRLLPARSLDTLDLQLPSKGSRRTANVNPHVDHPRWSQKNERRIGRFFRQETRMFNGYADQVAQLYAGMDLRRNY